MTQFSILFFSTFQGITKIQSGYIEYRALSDLSSVKPHHPIKYMYAVGNPKSTIGLVAGKKVHKT